MREVLLYFSGFATNQELRIFACKFSYAFLWIIYICRQ
jgi:hypothetical protein